MSEVDWTAEQHKCPYMRGPWEIEESSREIRAIHRTQQGGYLEIGKWSLAGISIGSAAYHSAKAHAQKLAAAPDLLAACQAALDNWEPATAGDIQRQLEAAIAKATT